jgi:hypothetical protein
MENQYIQNNMFKEDTKKFTDTGCAVYRGPRYPSSLGRSRASQEVYIWGEGQQHKEIAVLDKKRRKKKNH